MPHAVDVEDSTTRRGVDTALLTGEERLGRRVPGASPTGANHIALRSEPGVANRVAGHVLGFDSPAKLCRCRVSSDAAIGRQPAAAINVGLTPLSATATDDRRARNGAPAAHRIYDPPPSAAHSDISSANSDLCAPPAEDRP